MTLTPPHTTPDRECVHRWIARASFPEERLRCKAFVFSGRQDEVILKSRRDSWETLFGSAPEKKAEILARRGLTEKQWQRALCDVEVSEPEHLPEWAKTFIELYEHWLSGAPGAVKIPAEKPHFLLARPWAELSRFWLNEHQARCASAGVRLAEASVDDLLENFMERLLVPLWSLLQPHPYFFRNDDAASRARRLQTLKFWEQAFDRKPILVHIIGHLTLCWRTATLEMLDRFVADLPKLSATFWEKPLRPGDDIMVSRLRCGLGDPHRGGRSVAIFETNRGDVVYKPKDLVNTRAIGLLLRELHSNNHEFVPLTPLFLHRDGYGWEQRVEPRQCDRISQVETFYRRLGGWLFLLELLNGNDFWYDNLIACADMPFFIDYETVIGNSFDDLWRTAGENEHVQQFRKMTFVGILPLIMPGSVKDDTVDGIDISVAAPPGKQRVPFREQDTMDGFADFEARDYAPFYRDEFQDMNNFLEIFIEGYRDMSKLLESDSGYAALQRFLESVENARFRHIIVHTWQCYSLLATFFRCCTNDGVRAAIALDGYFSIFPDFPLHIVEGIKNDIWNNDVPLFEMQPDRLCVFNTSGAFGEEDFFQRTALDKIKENYVYLIAERERRVEHIKALFSTRPDNPRRPWRQNYHQSGLAKIETDEELLSAAKETGDDLASLINETDDLQNWLAIGRLDLNANLFVLPLPLNFEGCSGIIVFLSRLQANFSHNNYTDALRKCYRYLGKLEEIYQSYDISGNIGLLSPYGSKITALCHLSRVRGLGDIDIRSDIEKLLEDMFADMRNSTHLYADYRHGICGLLCLFQEMEFIIGEDAVSRRLQQLLTLAENATLHISPKQTDAYTKYADRFSPESGCGLLRANRYMQDRRPALTKHPGYLKLLDFLKTQPARQPNGDAPSDTATLSGEDLLDQGYRLLAGSRSLPQHVVNPPLDELVRRKRHSRRWFPENWADDQFLPGAVYGQADVGLLVLGVRARKNLNPFRTP